MVASELSASPAQPAQSHIPHATSFATVASPTSGAASIDEQYLEVASVSSEARSCISCFLELPYDSRRRLIAFKIPPTPHHFIVIYFSFSSLHSHARCRSIQSQARRWLSQTLSRTLPADKPLSDLLGDGEILLELACLVQQLLAPDVPPSSASFPLTADFDSAPPANPRAPASTAATTQSGAAAEGGTGVSAADAAAGDDSGNGSGSANGSCSSEESGGAAGGSGFKRAYWHACTNVERFLKVSGGLSIALLSRPRSSEGRSHSPHLARPCGSQGLSAPPVVPASPSLRVPRFLLRVPTPQVCRRVGLREVSLFTSDLVDARQAHRSLTLMSPVPRSGVSAGGSV
ncbi:unnamed protein product [Closterium sp. Yama58-4]|nr:unnamed protein product [Closterium sp. Yama58-4]